ncbi:hypothetical protein WJX74_001523 [Apatococcus lobatus]|uniref:BTB domain-containing protein n=1 Tax=Apatococcus lobatus TaxID=904363 RepID=A0AAW1Q2I2_9CHLO
MLQDLGKSRRTFTEEQLVIPASMLSDFTAEDVKAFLCQVYNFNNLQLRSVEEAHQLLRLADRFDSAKLLKHCADYLCSQHDALFKPTTGEEGALKWALLAEQHGLDDMLSCALKYIACNFFILRSDVRLGQLRAATLVQLTQDMHAMTSVVTASPPSMYGDDEYNQLQPKRVFCRKQGCIGHQQPMKAVYFPGASAMSHCVGMEVQPCHGHAW